METKSDCKLITDLNRKIMNKDLSILVVCGGISSEREISLKSGNSVYEALKRIGYSNVTLFDLNRNDMSDILIVRPDIVFIALHGKGGEDGSIQGMLELAGIPYTGPGVAASAICMNKILTKRILQNAGLPTANFLAFRKDEVDDRIEDIKKQAGEKIGYPMVLKAPCEGSSIGVVIIKTEEEFYDAVKEVFSHGDELLIEEFVKGIEITLPIMGNNTITTLPVIEITSEREFYDYTAKYTKGLYHHIIPACIDKETEKENESAMEKISVIQFMNNFKNILSYGSKIGFFFGAGTSCAFGLPTIKELTENVKRTLSDEQLEWFLRIEKSIKEIDRNDNVTIENILTKLRGIQELTCCNKDVAFQGVSGLQAQQLDKEICENIY